MKKLLSVLFSLFLAFTLIFSGTTVNVMAENDSGTITEIQEHKNPRYYPDEAENELTAAEIESLQDILSDDDVKYVRQQMKNRVETVKISMPYDSEIGSAASYLVNAAIQHTGVPTEGDYLGYQYGGYSARYVYTNTTADITLQLRYYTTADQEEKVDQAVKALISELDVTNKTDYLKIKAVYDWIADHVSYEYNYANISTYTIYSAYGALVDRKAVCQGYSVLFYRMMLELGIDCRVISGGGHAWNIVKLGNKYYNIDVTWASTAQSKSAYFLKGSKNFTDHYPSSEFTAADFTSQYPIDTNDYVVSEDDLKEDTRFIDVRDESKYYYIPVYWAVENGITVGYGGKNKFSPYAACTREQIVTFLWRLMGEPEPETESSFADVAEDAWYYKPITWAYENGITTGLNDGTERFGVGQPCTREQCVTFLYRTAGEPEVEEHAEFTDVTSDDYFYDSISWAAANGVTVGLNDGTGRFGVGQTCTRGMIVTFLYRFAHLE